MMQGACFNHRLIRLALARTLIVSAFVMTINRQHWVFAHEGACRAQFSTYSIFSSSMGVVW